MFDILHYSGGHFNPAVTLGVTLSKGVQPTVAVGYFISQLLGGMLGAAFVRVRFSVQTVQLSDRKEEDIVFICLAPSM